MLISLGLPFSDARRFMLQRSDYLKNPPWAQVEAEKSFVPYFGRVERRERKYTDTIKYLSYENEIANIKSLKFHNYIQLLDYQASQSLEYLPPRYTFKRLWFDEQAVGFFEVGIAITNKKAVLTSEQTRQMLNNFLKLEVAVKDIQIKDGFRLLPLYQAHECLAKLFQIATKNIFPGVDFPVDPQSWIIHPGIPIFFVEYNSQEETIQIPYWMKSITSSNNSGLRVHYSFLPCSNSFIRIWLIGCNSKASSSTLPKIKSILLNIHTEHECLRSILKLILEGKVKILSRSAQSKVLQNYLHDSIKRINFLEEEITRELNINFHENRLEYTNPLTRREEIKLHDEILRMDFRRNIYDMVEDYIDKWSRIPKYPQCYFCNRDCSYEMNLLTESENESKQALFKFDIAGGNAVIDDHSQKIDFRDAENVTVGDIEQIAAQTIQNAFKTVERSNASQELKEKLTALTQAVAKMSEQLPSKAQERAAQDLKILTDEATSDEPRKRWYELSAEGLIDAAKTIGEIATPVIKTTKEIIAILAL